MAKKRFALFVIFCSFFVFRAEAMVSLLIIEAGLDHSRPAMEHSMLWEDSIMGAFFDAGHIVTNVPIQRFSETLEGGLSGDALLIMERAIEGGEFLVVAILDYSGAAFIPGRVSLQVFSANPKTKIHERDASAAAQGSQGQHRDRIRAVIAGVIPYLMGN
ncbi:MAG: hypothetical protein FWG66_01195 [Spirochaetes bacterium]|nr:hypothetical protein [Spirochaetota bacterium]